MGTRARCGEIKTRWNDTRNSPEAIPLPGHGEVKHCVDPVVNRNPDPLVGPLERVGMESLIISDAFRTLPAVDFRQKSAHGTVIEGGTDKVYTLALVLDAVAPGLHDLVACRGKQMISKRKEMVER